MAEPKTLRINDVDYVRKDSLSVSELNKGPIKIVVLDRGFVFVGRQELTPSRLRITEARNIRVWGTTKGLGELVNGPLSGTKLDAVGTVVVSRRAYLFSIDVNQAKWE